MRCLACLLAALVACAPADTEPPPTPAEAVEQVSLCLEDAAYHHGNGHLDTARAAWLEARQGLRDDLLPAIRENRGEREALEVEYLMGRVRAELDNPRGKPDPLVEQTQEALREALPEPVEQELVEGTS